MKGSVPSCRSRSFDRPSWSSPPFGGSSNVFAGTHLENSDVLPFGSVAVAVMNSPTADEAANVARKLALPSAAVVALIEPRNR